MSLLSRILFLLVTTGVFGFANIPISLTMTDPNFGKPNDICPGCGDPTTYAIQDFTLLGPAAGGTVGTWTLTIDTNYGVNPVGLNSMPDFCSGLDPFSPVTGCPAGEIPYFMSDFLIQQGNTHYGIVNSTGHVDYTSGSSDSYVAGNLYLASGFLPSLHGNPTAGPVILAPFGTKENTGTGTLSVAVHTGAGGASCVGNNTQGATHDCALYRVTDTFTVGSASNFFDPTLPITIYASSADCFNATLVVTTPEPGGLIWLLPGLLLLGAYLRRRSLADVR